MPVFATNPPAADRLLRGDPRRSSTTRGPRLGHVDHRADGARARVLLLPLTLKQFKSMQRWRSLQPEIKKLQEKYKNDKERLNQEMMKFYRENKVNPFASCLPLVAQLPVFLVAVLHAAGGPAVRHLPGRQPAERAPNPQPVRRRRRRAVPLHPGPDEPGHGLGAGRADRALRRLAAAVDAADVDDDRHDAADDHARRCRSSSSLFVWQFPAGLLVYWITTNLWTIVQQAIVRKRLGPLRPPAAGAGALGDMIEQARRGGDGRATTAKAAEAPQAKIRRPRGRPAPATSRSGRPSGPPPAPPRKKKKRSGRRR